MKRKNLAAILFPAMLLSLLLVFATGVSADDSLSVRGVSFLNGKTPVYVMQSGNIHASFCVENTATEAKDITLITALYSNDKLCDISYCSVNIPVGTNSYSGDTVVATSTENTIIKAFAWDKTMQSLSPANTLNNVSCNNGISSLTFNIAGTTYAADVNTAKNKATAYVMDKYEDSVVPQGVTDAISTVSPTLGTDNGAQVLYDGVNASVTGFATPHTCTITAPNGNKATYDIAIEAVARGWDEQFTGAKIVEAGDTWAGKSFPVGAPSSGSWRGGTPYGGPLGYGNWKTPASGTTFTFSVDKSEDLSNTYLAMYLSGAAGTNDFTYYNVKGYWGGFKTPVSKKIITEYKFMADGMESGSAMDARIAGCLYYYVAPNSDGTLKVVQRTNGADAGITLANALPSDDWNKLRVVSYATDGVVANKSYISEIYINDKFVCEIAPERSFTLGGEKQLMNLENAFYFKPMGGMKGKFLIDDAKVMFDYSQYK